MTTNEKFAGCCGGGPLDSEEHANWCQEYVTDLEVKVKDLTAALGIRGGPMTDIRPDPLRAALLHQLDGGTYQAGAPQRALLAVLDQHPPVEHSGCFFDDPKIPPRPAQCSTRRDIATALGIEEDR